MTPMGGLAEYSKVDLVVFDYSVSPEKSLVEKGKLHPGILSAKTVTLEKSDIEKLLGFVTGKNQPEPGAFCYQPHHGFIFYNEREEVAGYLEICLSCGNYQSYPEKGLSQYWNLVGIKKLVKSKGLPVYSDFKKWGKILRAEPVIEQV